MTKRFFFLALPFGSVANGFSAILLPVLLRQAGVAVGDIGIVEGVFLLPLVLQFLWTVLFENRVHPGRALVATAALAAVFSAAALLSPVSSQLSRFLILAFAGQLCASLSFACCGTLMAAALPEDQWGRASGYAMAGVLGGGALGGTLLTYFASTYGCSIAAGAIIALTAIPALSAISIGRYQTRTVGWAESFGEAKHVLRSAPGKRLLIFALSPAGAAGMLTLFSALGRDYGVTANTIAMTNGLLGAVCMAVGSLVGGAACDRFTERRPMLWVIAGTALGCIAIGSASLAITPSSYIAGVLSYDFFAGIVAAVYPVIVLEVVGKSSLVLTLYALYYGIGVLATTYSTIIDSQFHDRHGPQGTLFADGLLNLAGAVVLATTLFVSSQRGPTERLASNARGK